MPVLEFCIDSRTYRFDLHVIDLRRLARGQHVALRSPTAECLISPCGSDLEVDFQRTNGRGLKFEIPVSVLRAGMRSLTEPPRLAVVDAEGRCEIRVSLTDLVWGDVSEGGLEIALEGSDVVVRLGV